MQRTQLRICGLITYHSHAPVVHTANAERIDHLSRDLANANDTSAEGQATVLAYQQELSRIRAEQLALEGRHASDIDRAVAEQSVFSERLRRLLKRRRHQNATEQWLALGDTPLAPTSVLLITETSAVTALAALPSATDADAAMTATDGDGVESDRKSRRAEKHSRRAETVREASPNARPPQALEPPAPNARPPSDFRSRSPPT